MDSYFEGRPWSVTYAQRTLPILVSLAERRQKTTYKKLAGRIRDEKDARAVSKALWTLGKALESLEKKERKKLGKIPPIQLLVCNGTTGRPGDSGLGWIGLTKNEIARMPKRALDKIVSGVQQDIFGFGCWPEVLKLLGLKRLKLPLPATERLLPEIKKFGQHSTGEGKEHERLKHFLAEHPRKIGIPWKGFGETEQTVLSGDRLDISFLNARTWIGVEVKGKSSPEADLIRGIFQCVKYRAVLESQLRYEAIQGMEQDRKIVPRVLLACGAKLPSELLELAELLDVEVKAKINIPDDFVAKHPRGTTND